MLYQTSWWEYKDVQACLFTCKLVTTIPHQKPFCKVLVNYHGLSFHDLEPEKVKAVLVKWYVVLIETIMNYSKNNEPMQLIVQEKLHTEVWKCPCTRLRTYIRDITVYFMCMDWLISQLICMSLRLTFPPLGDNQLFHLHLWQNWMSLQSE